MVEAPANETLFRKKQFGILMSTIYNRLFYSNTSYPRAADLTQPPTEFLLARSAVNGTRVKSGNWGSISTSPRACTSERKGLTPNKKTLKQSEDFPTVSYIRVTVELCGWRRTQTHPYKNVSLILLYCSSRVHAYIHTHISISPSPLYLLLACPIFPYVS